MIHSTKWIQKYFSNAKFVFVYDSTLFDIPPARNHVYLAQLYFFCQVVIHIYNKWAIRSSDKVQRIGFVLAWIFSAANDLGNMGQSCNLANVYTSHL